MTRRRGTDGRLRAILNRNRAAHPDPPPDAPIDERRRWLLEATRALGRDVKQLDQQRRQERRDRRAARTARAVAAERAALVDLDNLPAAGALRPDTPRARHAGAAPLTG